MSRHGQAVVVVDQAQALEAAVVVEVIKKIGISFQRSDHPRRSLSAQEEQQEQQEVIQVSDLI